MDSINKLTDLFTKLPGVGPRQARRMVFYLLRTRRDTVDEIVRLIGDLKKNVTVCQACYRHFVPPQPGVQQCSVCSDGNRTHDTLMIVEKDVDFENIERSGTYTGMYFILGGLYSPLGKNPTGFMHIDALKQRIAELVAQYEMKEIIIALAVNPDGEETVHFLKKELHDLCENHQLNITMLGRGLSTGSELEYADAQTIQNAFESRH